MYEEKRKKERNFSSKYFPTPKLKQIQTNFIQLIPMDEWKKLLFKLFTLFIFIFLFIFTISRLNKHAQNMEIMYNNNVMALKKYLYKFYNQNPLPKNIGDYSFLTLEKMDNAPLIDSQNTCDYTNSYIVVTKLNKEEYTLKIVLQCQKNPKITEEIIKF